MNTHQILYTKQMILAKLNGWKTVTRRPIKQQEQFLGKAFELYDYGPDQLLDILEEQHEIKCPFGRSGDQLWTKENYEILEYSDFEQAAKVKYRADGHIQWVQLHDKDWAKYKDWKELIGKKSKLFMFKTLSRFWDEITEISIERVQEITAFEVQKEGVFTDTDDLLPTTYISAFRGLWQSMYQGGPFDYNNNPFVWVVRNKPLIINGELAANAGSERGNI